MCKIVHLACSLFVITALCVGPSACKDDEPYIKPNLSVNTETITVSEDAGIIGVELVLDKAAPADITITYALGGSAVSPADYGIVGKDGEFTIPKGATSVALELEIADDKVYEEKETIEITIEISDRGDVAFASNTSVLINITDDDDIIVSFATATMNVKESDREVEVIVNLSHSAPGDITISYSLAGTATDSVTAVNVNPQLLIDYAIRAPSQGTFQILAGQTTGLMRLVLFSDFLIEDGDPTTDGWNPETIRITLTDVSSGALISPTGDEVELKVDQEDGKVIALFWDVGTGIDLDLFLWSGDIGTPVGNFELAAVSAFETTEGPEYVFIPKVVTEANFGVSYVYYAGDVTPMNFESHFFDFANGTFGESTIYAGSYTLANLNMWTDLDDLVHIEQTFEVTAAGEYVNISAISTPTTGSRVATYELPKGTKKNYSHSFSRTKF